MNAILKPAKTPDVFLMPVHPAADVFPMLDDDELGELANDISENGLRQPLVIADVGGQWMLVDGRNRRAACKLVNVDPSVEVLGGDPVEYILSANIHRRHMTKGQRAMAVARVLPEKGHGQTPRNLGLSSERVRQARTVLQWRPELADQVLAGSASLDDAYQAARDAKLAADSAEQRFERLKAASPELATDVVEGRLTLEGAIAEQQARENQRRAQHVAIAKNITNFALFASNMATQKHVDEAAAVLRTAPKVFKESAGMTVEEYLAALRAIRDKADSLLKRVSTHG